MRRVFSNEFKQDAVSLVIEQGYSCEEAEGNYLSYIFDQTEAWLSISINEEHNCVNIIKN